MFYNTKEKILNVNNDRINYITFGRGKKNLIMIQGLNTNGIHGSAIPLALMYRIFTKEYKVFMFERRSKLEPEITILELAKDIENYMDALGINNADVIGVSQGGMIAQYLAINRPDLVNKLVLVATLSKSNETVTQVIENWVDLTKNDNYKELVKDMMIKMYSSKSIRKYKPLLPLLTILHKPKDKERFITLSKSCLTCDTYDFLDEIKCPTLVIGGKEDKIIGPNSIIEIIDKLNCEFHIYENLGHALYEEAKDFNKLVYIYLTKGE